MSIFKKLFNKNDEESNDSFHTFKIFNIIRETPKAVTLVFEKPAIGFDYQSGQYLTLKTSIDGKEVQRPYSLCSMPDEDILKVTIKETEDGYFSKYANQKLKKGDEIEIMPPGGSFTYEPKSAKNILCVAGGSGITPIYSIINNALSNDPNSFVYLIYGNRSENDIIFKKDIDSLKQSFGDRLSIVHVLSDENDSSFTNYNGYLNEGLLSELQTELISFQKVDAFYLCGPEPMIDVVEQALGSHSIPKENINKELFTAPTNLSEEVVDINDVKSSSVIKGTYSGKEFSIDYTDPKKSILDTALDAGFKIPFSCINGVCSTCSAKLISGTVKMNQNFALEEEDVQNGYILTCQSFPTSPEVEINWDDNKM